MRLRTLGRGGPAVSAIGLGCMGLVDGYFGAVSADRATRAVHRALDLGITLFDTADSYGAGVGEERLGAALAGRRDGVILASKVGLVANPSAAGRVVDGRPEYVRAGVEASLGRLRTDVIDLYQLHRVDPQVPVEETVGAMATLVAEGKVRYLGVSEVTPEQLRRAAAVHPLVSVQSEYSLFERGVEAGVLPECDRLGAALIAFAPLGKGLLTGRLQSVTGFADSDLRSRLPRFGGAHLRHNQQLAATLGELAGALDITPGQLALAWLLSRSALVLPIPGSTSADHLAENAAACDIDLPAEVLVRIDAVLAADPVSGARYPEGWRLPGS
ncbi:aldo/keto reductase [Dactylosporangium sp. NPDC000555]|uniref:aldo/keto reductase n=1 Tax=Dactylosporangium sp. NPDC000555 TaxID=3154260 RepID=UPI00331E099C